MPPDHAPSQQPYSSSLGPEAMSRMFYALAERLNDGVCAFNAEGLVSYANSALADMLASDTEDLLGTNIFRLIDPVDLSIASSLVKNALKGVGETLELRWVRNDGREVWSRTHTVPLKADDGSYTGAALVVQNISEKRSHDDLRARLAAIVDASDNIIVSMNLDGIIEFWSKGAKRVFGYTSEEMVGEPIYKIIPPEKRAEQDETLRKLRLGERIEQLQTIRRAKNGRLVNVSLTIAPIRDSEGKVVGASKVGRDITDQLKQDELHSRLAAIVESSDDAIISKDLNGIIQTWNKGAEDIFGYTAEEIVGKPIHTLLPDDRLGEENLILDRLRKGQRIDHYETIRKRKDGTLVDVSVTVSPIRGRGGIVVGASNISRNITERKRADEALRKSEESLRALTQELEQRVLERTKDLEAANTEMEGFTYSVSHDLRSPLRAIVSTAMILLEEQGEKLDAEGRELLERQAVAGQRLAKLIDDLLKLSRVSRTEMHMYLVDLSSLANEIASDLKSEPECRVEFSIQPKMLAVGDPKLLKLALQNLLENARKFSPQGGSVNVGAREVNGTTIYFVKDEGIGFDPKYSRKLFLPFERLVREQEFEGTGVGLANVKRIIERHGGRVWAESSPGQGATFLFTLQESPEDVTPV